MRSRRVRFGRIAWYAQPVDRIARLWELQWVRALALGAAVVLAYAGSLGGGFLNYDDGWLIRDNPLLQPDAQGSLAHIWFDFSHATRMALGAEYLPLRDTSIWLDAQLFGLHAPALRATQLALYVIACLLFRASFVRLMGAGFASELTAWLFALHPVHVESTAWLAGRKDVLALLFIGGALWRHAAGSRDQRWSVPLLCACACLSKSMSVGIVGPMLAYDIWLRRRPCPWVWGASLAAMAATVIAHLQVGAEVHMIAEPLGGSRATAAMSMGPVWLRYLHASLDPRALSLRHDSEILTHWTGLSLLGWALLLGSGAAAAWGWRLGKGGGGERLGIVAWLWFAVPLAPVSQVFMPLQNTLADRYAWLSVGAVCLLLGQGVAWLAARDGLQRLALPTALGWTLLFGMGTAQRAPLFADSIAVFTDATLKTRSDAAAPYQLSKALEQAGRPEDAIAGYGEVLRRAQPRDPIAARATNNLSALLAARGALPAARSLLLRSLEAHPDNAKLRGNLAKVEAAMAPPAPIDTTTQQAVP